MERTRAWRRNKADYYYLRRIKRQIFTRYLYIFWRSFPGIMYHPTWLTKIGAQETLAYKSVRTTKWRSKIKVKWGKRGRCNYDWSSDPNTRHKDKVRFRKELREYGY